MAVQAPRNRFYKQLAEVSDAAAASSGAFQRVAETLDRIEQRLVAQRSDRDRVAAVYAAAFGTTGDVDDRTYVGQWLRRAGIESIQDMIKQPRYRERHRAEFTREMCKLAADYPRGLPSLMNQFEIERLYDAAPGVWAAMKEGQTDRQLAQREARHEREQAQEAAAQAAQAMHEAEQEAAAKAAKLEAEREAAAKEAQAQREAAAREAQAQREAAAREAQVQSQAGHQAGTPAAPPPATRNETKE